MSASAPEETPRVQLKAWLLSDVGCVREHNEDSAYVEPARGFFIVADGMGGHAAGEVASAMAVDTVRTTLEGAQADIDAFTRAPSDAGRRALVQLLQSAVLSAHQAVFQRGQTESDKQGMGTTLDVVLVAGPEAFVAHVGDSRTYLVRDGKITQLTTDHTVAEVLVIEGKLTIEEAKLSTLKNVLVNALGVSQDVGVEMAHVTLKRDDRILLCSDGLHDHYERDDEIAERLSAPSPEDALTGMVETAKQRGGFDNITGVVVHITDVAALVQPVADGETTQPVEITGDPFAADEPTQTAVSAQALIGRAVAPASSSVRATQPMRVVVGGRSGEDGPDDGLGDTIPPSLSGGEARRPVGDASWDGNTDAGAPVPASARPPEAPADEAPRAASGDADAVPTPAPVEATADTGKVVVPPADKR